MAIIMSQKILIHLLTWRFSTIMAKMLKRRILSIVIIILAAGLAYFIFSDIRPFHLGLDLRGGSHLVYEADTSTLAPFDIADSMESLRGVIERRINAFGVSEPIIQSETAGLGPEASHRLIVELPGITDLKEALNLIDATPVLEFKEERPEGPEKEAIKKTITDFNAAIKEGEAPPQDISLELLNSDPNFIPTALTGRYLKRAQVAFGQNSISPSISIEFNAEGAKLFADLTEKNLGQPIAIYLDGKPLSAPVVRDVIRDGRAEISGDFTLTDARDLARDLNLGALPVAIKLLSTETVGPTLGQEALDRGITAGLVGLLFVASFMVFWYRLNGLIAAISLAIYIVLVLAIFKLLPVTLTAAGIAGFILSIGIAIDADILIFERMKEELRGGKHLHEAINDGFARAWLSIRDSNLSTVISAVVLFWLGTSLIKGFALTLIIGIIVSLFTAITITRNLLLAVAPGHQSSVVKFLFGHGLKR